jgi:hypothetical protein
MPTSEDDCLAALREAAERVGESPTKAEYEALGLTPASATISRVVGGWNEAKERAGLETFGQDDHGGTDVEPRPEDVEIPADSEWEELTAQQRWYYRNRQHRIDTKEERRHRLRRWFYEVKRNEVECSQCGEERPPALDFHHDGSKTADVSSMVNDGYSRSRIRGEIDDCTVLCANCHREMHYDGVAPTSIPDRTEIKERIRTVPEHEARRLRRLWLLAYKRDSDGCEACDVSAPVCLDFHHEGEKAMGVAEMIAFGTPLREIRDEIRTCVLICANCHRDRHFTPPEPVD